MSELPPAKDQAVHIDSSRCLQRTHLRQSARSSGATKLPKCNTQMLLPYGGANLLAQALQMPSMWFTFDVRCGDEISHMLHSKQRFWWLIVCHPTPLHRRYRARRQGKLARPKAPKPSKSRKSNRERKTQTQ